MFLTGWPHPKICSYFSTMTCHVLVMPLSECLVEKVISAGFCRTMWMIRSAACFSLVWLVCLGGQYRTTSSILCIIFWNPERQQSFVQTLYTNAHPPSSLFCWRTNGVRLDTSHILTVQCWLSCPNSYQVHKQASLEVPLVTHMRQHDFEVTRKSSCASKLLRSDFGREV